MATPPTLEDARHLCAAADRLVERALERAREITEGGRRIDEHQVLAQRVAYAATQARAARETVDAAAIHAGGSGSGMIEVTAAVAVAELTTSLRDRLAPALDDLGLDEAAIEDAFPAEMRALLRRVGNESVLRSIGRHVAETRGHNQWPLDDISEQVREAVREFADKEVAPEAERIHRHDELVPERFISSMSELGYFGLAIPEAYGGSEMGNLAMIVTTEELSRASLAAAGSLITRPEILAKALLGTAAPRSRRSTGCRSSRRAKIMVGISVTEPDIGSDVASIQVPRRARDAWAARRAGSSTARSRGARSPVAPTCWRPARPHRPRPRQGRRRGSRSSSSRRSRSPATSSRPSSPVAASSRARPTPRPATAACTPSRCSSRTTSSPRQPGGRRQRARARLLPADGGLRGGAPADRRARLRPRPGGAREDRQVRRRSHQFGPADLRVPAHPVHAGPHGGVKLAGARAITYAARWPSTRTSARRAAGRAGQAARLRRGRRSHPAWVS